MSNHNPVVKTMRCPKCAERNLDTSEDNLKVYKDGTQFCFGECWSSDAKQNIRGSDLVNFEYISIKDRGLSKDTCEKYGIGCGVFTGKLSGQQVNSNPIYIFNMIEGNEVVTQKIRDVNDRGLCTQRGDTKRKKLFGQNLFAPTEKMIVIITEGEFDAAAMHQATGYPAVSVTRGAAGASSQIAANIDWLAQWKQVILCFDNDSAGIEATKKCLPNFEPGKVKVAKMPLKDANDMLLAGRGGELKNIIWNAEIIRPPTIVTIEDIMDDILKKPEMGMEWPWKIMTHVTRGFRTREIYVIAAATGVGKTQLVRELVIHLIKQKEKVGLFSFEQKSSNSVQRLISDNVGHKIYDPLNSWWDEEEIRKAAMVHNESLYLYNNMGSISWEELALSIRFIVKCYGVKCVVIDNLMAMCTYPIIDGKRVREHEYIAHIMSNLFSLVHELDVSFIVIAHLATDKISRSAYISTANKNKNADGKYFNDSIMDMDDKINKPGLEWETGRIPAISNIAGSANTARLADYVFGLARNQMSSDPLERINTKVKVLKGGRYGASDTGKIFDLYYDANKGCLTDDCSGISNVVESDLNIDEEI